MLLIVRRFFFEGLGRWRDSGGRATLPEVEALADVRAIAHRPSANAMQLNLETDTRIRLLYDDELELSIESVDPLVHFSPLHMLAASLATCSMAVLLAWADTIRMSTEGLALVLEWDYAEGPYRVGEYRMTIDWPGLPEKRRAVALRVAEQCTVDATLRFPPFIDKRIV